MLATEYWGRYLWRPMSQETKTSRRLVKGLFAALALLALGLYPQSSGETNEGASRLAAGTIHRIHSFTSPGWAALHDYFPAGLAQPVAKLRPVKAAAAVVRPLAASAVRVLEGDEAASVREAFSLIEEGQIPAASEAVAALESSVLHPYLQASLYLHPRNTAVTFGELHAWLSAYADLPQAKAIYEKAARLRGEAGASLPAPRWKQGLSGNIEAASGGLPAEWKRSRFLSAVAKLQQKKTAPEEVSSENAENEEDAAQTPAAAPSISMARAEELFRKGDMAAVLDVLAPLEAPAAEGQAYGFWLKGLAATATGQLPLAFASFAAASDAQGLEPAARTAAAFWAARSAEKLGDEDAQHHYLEMAAAAPRSFYGQLALARLGRSAEYHWDVPAYGPRHEAALKAHPAGARALALLQIGRMAEAEKELRGIHPRGDDMLEQALLAVSQAAGLPALSLQVAGALKKQGAAYDGALYPVPEKDAMKGVEGEAALVLAVARQESRFDASARSPRGAQGYMQIMPDTAEKLERGAAARLSERSYNLHLGDAYLRKLSSMKGVDGNLVYTLAAYNCGPGRLLELAARTPLFGKDALLFMETIPIRETRHYVQKVLQNYWAYQARFGSTGSSVRLLAEGQMPPFAAAPRLAAK